ncbi:MAG: PD40 domain-containing protein [Caldilineaceae bacterium]|nr:PD40 domain-containing protein [Caldilineaceae bacterium]
MASPKWSPDGQWILFSRGDEYWECRTLGFGTCVSGNLAGAPGRPLPPGFSLEDLPIKRTQEFNLAVVDTNGDNYHDIAALETARTPDWNEAGIVYQSSAGIQRTDDKPDAENTLVSFDYLNPYYYDPDWQPNGGRILFQNAQGQPLGDLQHQPRRSNMTNLTRPVTALVDALPSRMASMRGFRDVIVILYTHPTAAPIIQLARGAGSWMLDGGNPNTSLPLDVEIDYTFGGEQIVSQMQNGEGEGSIVAEA